MCRNPLAKSMLAKKNFENCISLYTGGVNRFIVSNESPASMFLLDKKSPERELTNAFQDSGFCTFNSVNYVHKKKANS